MKNIYQAPKILNRILLILVLILSGLAANSQNVAVTDDDTYVAKTSAMLDVKSDSKGLLIPRLTEMQRTGITSPATGLLVYDTDNSSFYYFDGVDWLSLSKMNTTGTGSALFAVLNTSGDTVFAVYDDGAKVIVPLGAKGKVGGFAVSGRNTTVKADPADDISFLHVTPDSTRITFDESGLKGKVGGFAVSGRNTTAKGTTTTSIINLFPDNYFIGDSAGINTTGLYNTFFGYKSGRENTAGTRNVFMGYHAGLSNQTSSYNVYIGNEVGESIVGGVGNVLIGYQVAKNDVSSKFNAIIGYQAGFSNTGDYNAIYGYKAGYTNTGNFNAIYGPYAAYSNTGHNNAIYGYSSGRSNTGNSNAIYGHYAGGTNTADSNSVFGPFAGFSNDGTGNAFFGQNSGFQNEGDYNVFLGYYSGRNNTTGANNVYIGKESGRGVSSGSTGSANVAVGFRAGKNLTNGSNNVFMGNQAGTANTTGYSNVFIGNSTFQSTTGSSQNVAIGNSCASDVTSTVTSSVIMGDNALTGMVTDIPVNRSLFIGKSAGINLGEGSTSVSDCIFLGTNAGNGVKNTQYSTISSIVAVGNSSGSGSDGYRNVFIGNAAGSQFVGHQNTMIGFNVGTQGGSGTYNVYIGDQCALEANGNSNTYIGRTAGAWVNGDNNVFLGVDAGRAQNTSPRTESDRLRIGSSDLIYGEFDNDLVRINGTLDISGNYTFPTVDGAANEVLTTNGSGTLSWADPGDNLGNHIATQNLNLNSNQITGIDKVIPLGTDDYDKIRVYSSANYTIGMHSAMSLGYLNDWSMTFTMSNTANRGWVWRDVDDLQSDGAMSLTTDGRLYVKSTTQINGELGIGVAPSYPLDIYTNATETYAARLVNDGNSTARYGMRIQCGEDDPTGTNYFVLFYDGNGGYEGSIRTVAGTLSLYNSSDKRLKDNIISTQKGGLDIINNLRVVDYFKKDDKSKTVHTGFIAQEVQKVFPDMVSINAESEYLSISQSHLIPILTKATQEQDVVIKSQNERIDKLEKEIEELKAILLKNNK